MNMDSSKEESNVDIFDYVLVGAGPSAMGILRGLLEEIQKVADSSNGHLKTNLSIAVVERGDGPPHDTVTQYPERWFEAANLSSHSSKSVKVYPSEITGRRIEIPVGQGLGGTSNINACLCLPPLQQDLESWPDPFRSELVSNANYLRNVMEENKCIQYTSIEKTPNPFSPQNSILDFYTTVPTLTAWDTRTNRVVRRNYYDSLVKPFLEEHPSLEKHVHWFRGYEAQRLLVEEDDSTRVIGIECKPASSDRSSEYRKVHANKRVILCAGAIETPALLLVSNLGDKEPLMGVGQRLMDQALIARVYFRSPSIGYKEVPKSASGIAALAHLRIEGDCGKGESQTFQVAITDSVADASIVPSSITQSMRWKYKSKILTEILEIFFRCMRITIRFSILYTPLGFLMHQLTTATLLFLMHPKSSGSVTVLLKKDIKPESRGPKRREDVTIEADPRYLQDPQDVKDLKNAWDTLSRLSSSSMENFQWFESYCSRLLLPYYHFSGTCSMMTRRKDNRNWVVDGSLKVRGHNGLHICDASVFPNMISNPPALTCAALGYTFARSIVANNKNK